VSVVVVTVVVGDEVEAGIVSTCQVAVGRKVSAVLRLESLQVRVQGRDLAALLCFI